MGDPFGRLDFIWGFQSCFKHLMSINKEVLDHYFFLRGKKKKGKTWNSLSRLISYVAKFLTERNPGHAACEKINLSKAKLLSWGPMSEQSKVQGVPRALDKQLPLPLPSCQRSFMPPSRLLIDLDPTLKSQFLKSFLQEIVLHEHFFMPLQL